MCSNLENSLWHAFRELMKEPADRLSFKDKRNALFFRGADTNLARHVIGHDMALNYSPLTDVVIGDWIHGNITFAPIAAHCQYRFVTAQGISI